MKNINYAIFHGVGYAPEMDKFKFSIAKQLATEFNVTVVSYFPNEATRELADQSYNVDCIYSQKYFKHELTEQEIFELEKWLGTPFLLIARYVHKYSDPRYQEKLNEPKFRRQVLLYIAQHVHAWKNFFEKNKISVFSNVIEPKIVETTSNLVAERLGLVVANIDAGRMSNTFMIYNSSWIPVFWKKLSSGKRDEYAKILIGRYANKEKPEYETMISDFKKTGKTFLGLLTALKDELALYRKLNKSDDLRYAPPEIRVIKRIFDKRIRMVLSRIFYTKNFDPEKEKYFFFPLHFTEESSLSVRERFLDQYDILKAISWALPTGIKLVIKPHPHWYGSDIELKKMWKIKNNDNVIVLPHSTSPYNLIRNAIGVVIINSTTGLETIALGKPLITFGHDVYGEEGLAIKIRDFKDLPKAINDCINSRKTFDEQKRAEFLANYYAHSIQLSGRIGDKFELTEDDTRNIANQLIEYITYSMR